MDRVEAESGKAHGLRDDPLLRRPTGGAAFDRRTVACSTVRLLRDYRVITRQTDLFGLARFPRVSEAVTRWTNVESRILEPAVRQSSLRLGRLWPVALDDPDMAVDEASNHTTFFFILSHYVE